MNPSQALTYASSLTQLTQTVPCILRSLTVLAVGLLLFAEHCSSAPAITYVRDPELMAVNLTEVLQTVPFMKDDVGCSMLCKKNSLCGGFTLDATACTLYGVEGATFVNPIGVGVGYFPTP